MIENTVLVAVPVVADMQQSVSGAANRQLLNLQQIWKLFAAL